MSLQNEKKKNKTIKSILHTISKAKFSTSINMYINKNVSLIIIKKNIALGIFRTIQKFPVSPIRKIVW